MNCFYHPDREAVNTCSRCGQAVCNVCNYIIGTHPICLSCWDRQVSTPKVDVGAQPEKSERGGATKCGNHPDVDALTACSYCRAPICPECCFYDQGKPVCLKCLESGIVIEAKSPRSKKWLGVLLGVLVGIGIIGYWLANANEEPPLATETLPAYVQQYVNKDPLYLKASSKPIHLVNNANAKDVSFTELESFLLQDDTDDETYILGVRTCGDFAEKLHNNAEGAGIRAAFVAVHFSGQGETPHALNAFKTTDKSLVYIDCTGPGFKPATYRQSLHEKAGPCELDKVAYVNVGEELGAISIDWAKSLQYSFYIEYTQKWLQYEHMLEDYNNEVTRYNQKATERVYYIGSSEWAAMKAWEAELIEKEQALDELGSQLGECLFESLGIVETIEIYW